jgi:hypothetical protein
MAPFPPLDAELSTVLRLSVSFLAALIFTRAAVLKWRARESFVGVVQNYDLLPEPLVAPTAFALPIAEGLLAAGLIIPWTLQRLADLAAAGLLAIFALAMVVNLARGRGDIDCGCGDAKSRQPIGPGLVVRNLLLAVGLTAAGLPPAGQASLADAVVAFAAIAPFFLLYLCQEAFSALPRRRRAAPLPAPDPRLGFAIHHRSAEAR